MELIKTFELFFSYGQFTIFDTSLEFPALDWTERHSGQGFARRNRIVSVGTVLAHGRAPARVFMGAPGELERYRRAIEVPIEVASGEVAFSNPDALPEEAIRIGIEPGHYRLVIAQAVDGEEDRESVDVYFDPIVESLKQSRILLADADLAPVYPLLETAETPDV